MKSCVIIGCEVCLLMAWEKMPPIYFCDSFLHNRWLSSPHLFAMFLQMYFLSERCLHNCISMTERGAWRRAGGGDMSHIVEVFAINPNVCLSQLVSKRFKITRSLEREHEWVPSHTCHSMPLVMFGCGYINWHLCGRDDQQQELERMYVYVTSHCAPFWGHQQLLRDWRGELLLEVNVTFSNRLPFHPPS